MPQAVDACGTCGSRGSGGRSVMTTPDDILVRPAASDLERPLTRGVRAPTQRPGRVPDARLTHLQFEAMLVTDRLSSNPGRLRARGHAGPARAADLRSLRRGYPAWTCATCRSPRGTRTRERRCVRTTPARVDARAESRTFADLPMRGRQHKASSLWQAERLATRHDVGCRPRWNRRLAGPPTRPALAPTR